MPTFMRARSKDAVALVSLLTTIGVLIGCGQREPTQVARAVVEMPPDEAERLYLACMDTMSMTTEVFRPVPSGTQAKQKHPDLELVTRGATRTAEFIVLYDRVSLVGMIDNKKSSTPHSHFDDKWKQGPPGKSCVYIGGDKTGLRARVVSKNGSTYSGEYREVAARWHTAEHKEATACWDKTPDDTDTPGHKECTETKHALSGEAGFGTSKVSGDAGVLSGDLAKRILADGNGPWYTCSQYTCCKPL